MRQRIQLLKQMITVNWRTLITFAIIYRILGVLVFFPIIRFLFLFAIRISPYDYVTINAMADFLMLPSTIGLILLIGILLGAYAALELLALSVIYHYSANNKKLALWPFLTISLERLKTGLKKGHVFGVVLALLIGLLVNISHFSGIASTINIPEYWLDNITTFTWLFVSAIVLFIALLIAMIRHTYSFNALALENKSFSESRPYRQQLTIKQYLTIAFEFIVLNLILNVVLYGAYVIILAIIGAIVSATQTQEVVLGVLLTIFYTVYLLIASFAVLALVPINYAWLSTWFHSHEATNSLTPVSRGSTKTLSFKQPKVKWTAAIIVFLVVALNSVNVYGVITDERGLFDLGPPDIIAHRGASADAPENTIAALEKAAEQNADGIEFDVHLTSDNVPVVIHDRTVGRTTDAPHNLRVQEMTYEEIRALDAGAWFSQEFEGEAIPTLEEAIEVIDPHAEIFLDMKDYRDQSTEVVYEILEEMDVVDNTVFMSFSSSQLRLIKDLNEDIETLHLVSTFFGSIHTITDQPHVDHFGFEGHMTLNNPSYIDSVRARDKRLSVWTINTEEQLRDVTIAGVDGIITDYPVRAREVAYSQPTNPLITQILRDLFDN